MKLEDVKKLLVISDQVTHVRAELPFTDDLGGADKLEFIYNEGGLRFKAKHYHGWACVFHGYDEALFSDSNGYLGAVAPVQLDRRVEWARHIQALLQKAFLKARLQRGQPCRVMVPDPDGIPLFYDGFVKSVDAEDDSLLVTYAGGKQLTAKPKKIGNYGLTAYQGRGGSVVTLGGVLQTNLNNVVPK